MRYQVALGEDFWNRLLADRRKIDKLTGNGSSASGSVKSHARPLPTLNTDG